MAKADHTSSTPITERRLKIAADFYPVHIKDQPHSPAKPVPWIRLRGLWLRQAGFEVNENVKVRVMKGCLVITAE
ncbi:type I toxin-antitoxin system SymE family toxin [Pseudomonas sp. R4-83]|uniref:SymE family type I addiction module toxin n=1 Tax=unclassified Pseudomonas TaxID=196821 RepID=UPI00087D591A|nr:SymE family type I addiction module toxin [Pseudomonas sp. Z003-0.4C(8344-21)]SDS29736.1 toxic protein SymE [Pseudomonas sp. Z003-0.4C(8344-21)]